MIARERDSGCGVAWQDMGGSVVEVEAPNEPFRSGSHEFEHVFGPQASNDDVYKGLSYAIVKRACGGYNGTVFAYGQVRWLQRGRGMPRVTGRAADCVRQDAHDAGVGRRAGPPRARRARRV